MCQPTEGGGINLSPLPSWIMVSCSIPWTWLKLLLSLPDKAPPLPPQFASGSPNHLARGHAEKSQLGRKELFVSVLSALNSIWNSDSFKMVPLHTKLNSFIFRLSCWVLKWITELEKEAGRALYALKTAIKLDHKIREPWNKDRITHPMSSIREGANFRH